MPKHKSFEPSSEDLDRAGEAFQLEFVSFGGELERLEPNDFLPRYNRVRFKLRCRSHYNARPLFVTVRRHGSKIGAENYYTVPFYAEDMPVGAVREYELLSFDSFNLPFTSVSIEMCRPGDYMKRRVSLQHLERARKFASLIGGSDG
jgi:hypothetical protein